MAGMWCSSCGQEIGHPEEDLHDPENRSGIPESMGLDGIENEDAHVKVTPGPGGEGHRFMCRPSGKITKLLEHPPDEEPPEQPPTPSGGEQEEEPTGDEDDEPSSEPKRRKPRQGGGDKVYDLQESKTPSDLVRQVVTNEIYGLNDGQIKEMQDWVGIYEGRIPPDRLEEILRDFDGVSKQKARLMRTKYEVMLDREMRRQADDRGPSIGATAAAGGMPPKGRRPSPPSGGAPPQPQPPPSTPDDGSSGEVVDGDLREERRKRRITRRNDALDTAAEEFADVAAREIAADLGGFFGDAREILRTVFKRKAETDPDWFFEKMEQWDMDILDAVLEPSDRRKEEIQSEGMDLDSVDNEIDKALEQMEEGGEETVPGEETFMDEPIQEEEDEPSERIELEDVMGEQ